MKQAKINSYLLQALVFVTGIISLSLFVLPAVQAFANAPPLKPGCYQIEETSYISVACALENQARSIVNPYNKCFAGSNPKVLHEINCLDGSAAGGPQCAGNTEAGGLECINYGEDYENSRCEHGAENNADNCGIIRYIQDFINLLSGAVGIVLVGSLVFAGIRYSTAGADPKKVSDAKNRILNVAIALVAYLFFFSFLQWLVPGGLFQ